MEFELSEEQRMIKDAVRDVASDYDEEYWQAVREEHRHPEELLEDLADGGWFGTPFPAEYGGQGLGLFETVLIMEALAEEGAWIGAVGFVGRAVFGGMSVMYHGSEEQKERYLPRFAEGRTRWSLGVTEPDAGLNTANIATRAERDGDEFVVNGQKQWISGVRAADKLLLFARTTPREEADSALKGVTSFIVDPEDPAITTDEIPLDIYFPHSTYQVYVDDLRVHEDQVLGEVGEGLYQAFDTLNAERVTAATSAWGAGKYALEKASEYASEREVWAEPIGAHQAIQHPLADAYADLETARLALRKAAWQFDEGTGDVGEASNVANLQSGKAAWNAAEAAMTTYGGMSSSAEVGIAAAWSFIRHNRTIPVSEEMIRNYLGQHALDLPRSYER